MGSMGYRTPLYVNIWTLYDRRTLWRKTGSVLETLSIAFTSRDTVLPNLAQHLQQCLKFYYNRLIWYDHLYCCIDSICFSFTLQRWLHIDYGMSMKPGHQAYLRIISIKSDTEPMDLIITRNLILHNHAENEILLKLKQKCVFQDLNYPRNLLIKTSMIT